MTTMKWIIMSILIESNPEILQGKPVFKGTRIPVELIYELVGCGYTIDGILDEYPTLTRDSIIKVLEIGITGLENLQGKDIKGLIKQE